MTITEIPRPPERVEWLRLRHGYANASDAAAYMGEHPYKSLADLAVEKLAPEPEDVTSRAMERGNRLEEAVALWWADEAGVAVYEPEVLYAHGRLLATLDRRIVGAERDALEVKTTRHEVSDVLRHWWWQTQAQMLCADLDRVHVAVLDGSMDLASYTVERDDPSIARLVDAVSAAWDFIALGMMPEGVEMTAEHLARLYPEPTLGTYADIDAEGLLAVTEWEQRRRARLDAEKAEQVAKDTVARLIGEAEAARFDGRLICTWRANKPSDRPDWKALAADHPLLVESYIRSVPGPRVLRATKELGL